MNELLLLTCPFCDNEAIMSQSNVSTIRIITCYKCKIATVLPKKGNEKMAIQNYSMRVIE